MHGNVSSFGSANGISVVALADFGKPGVGGVDGSSGATGKSSNGGSASINNDEDEIEDDDLLALLEGDENAERSPKNTDKSDMYGKTLKTAVARVQNSGSVSGNITARAQQLKRPLNKNSYTPQFYDVSLITSGNGVSMANYIETPDKYTYSQEKQNHVSLDNSGNMRGQATLEGGARTTHTYTKSKGSGNGVSLFASTGRFAKNATRVALDNVNNDGHISGQIRQISGNNSGYNSPHMMSGSEAPAAETASASTAIPSTPKSRTSKPALAKSTTAAASAATPISKQATAPATSASTHAPARPKRKCHAEQRDRRPRQWRRQQRYHQHRDNRHDREHCNQHRRQPRPLKPRPRRGERHLHPPPTPTPTTATPRPGATPATTR